MHRQEGLKESYNSNIIRADIPCDIGITNEA